MLGRKDQGRQHGTRRILVPARPMANRRADQSGPGSIDCLTSEARRNSEYPSVTAPATMGSWSSKVQASTRSAVSTSREAAALQLRRRHRAISSTARPSSSSIRRNTGLSTSSTSRTVSSRRSMNRAKCLNRSWVNSRARQNDTAAMSNGNPMANAIMYCSTETPSQNGSSTSHHSAPPRAVLHDCAVDGPRTWMSCASQSPGNVVAATSRKHKNCVPTRPQTAMAITSNPLHDR
mmetsp:Transcript_53366/g.114405  ORF Transcript_53366/g.114405 Transcript_53366/m.114405 type:complete len:235 (-) Transcript_53366:484-1188(-)